MDVNPVGSTLNSYFSKIVNQLMVIESQPLTRIDARQATLNTRRSAISSMGAQLSDLLTIVKDLSTTGTSNSPFSKKLLNVSDISLANGTVVTASAQSTAVSGVYNVAVTQLALEHRVRSDQQTYDNQALGLSGAIIVGGAASRSTTTQATIANTVTAFGTAAPASGQKELGTGAYYVEVREDPANTGVYQFRVVDADGKAVAIDDAADAGTATTANYQALSLVQNTTFDTKRGLSITFGSGTGVGTKGDTTNPAAQVSYTAQGASITVSSTDALTTIATAINSATYADGNEVTATIVDRQLVLSAKDTGAAHTIAASDSSGAVLQTLGVLTSAGAFKNVMQSARDATFSVNGISISRGRNTGLTDVITGVTLDLAADAEGQSAKVTVARDDLAVTGKLQALANQLNSVLSVLAAQTGTNGSGNSSESANFTRGPLADELAFTSLRSNLFSDLNRSVSGLAAGAPTSLAAVGVTLDDGLQFTVDEAKFNAALAADSSGVQALLNAVADRVQTRLEQFTDSTSGVVQLKLNQIDGELQDADKREAALKATLDGRRLALTVQYARIQSQIAEFAFVQQQMSALSGAGLNIFG